MAVEIDVRNAQVETEAIRFTNNLKLIKNGNGVKIINDDGIVILELSKNQFTNLYAAFKVAEKIW